MITLPVDFDPASDHLRDRTVLVTGATGDLGKAVCAELARHGATVVLAGRSVPKLERLFDELIAMDVPEPAIYPIDLVGARPDDYADLANNIGDQLGRLDGVVHAASAFDGLTPLQQLPSHKWMAAVQVGLNAAFLINQSVIPLLAESGQGRLIFTLNDESVSRLAYWGAYGVCQAALRSLFAITAEELESSPVEVSAVQPPPLRSRHRSLVHMGESPETLAEPATAARAYLYLLGGDREGCHGQVLSWKE